MAPTETTKKHVIDKYVKPARQRGEQTIQVRVGSVLKELGWTNRTPSVFSTLSSRALQREAGIELIEKRGGPPSGGPSTTVEFVYRIIPLSERTQAPKPVEAPIPNGSGLKALFGILADTFRQLGGGEAYLKSERDSWEPDPWERLELERKAESEPQR
jgi:hypothetical protein